MPNVPENVTLDTKKVMNAANVQDFGTLRTLRAGDEKKGILAGYNGASGERASI